MITKEKNDLRNKLFERYFELEEGIPLNKLMNTISFIPETWHKLHKLLEENVENYDEFSNLKMIKIIEHNKEKYLIIKIDLWDYIIINLTKNKSLTQNEFELKFNENFFINNFSERKIKEDSNYNYLNYYYFIEYKGNIEELINFYIENKKILELPTKIYYKLTIEEAWTYFSVNLIDAKAQLGFQTKDQFLYEQLFLNYDLTPSGMQDAKSKIGEYRMQEMFKQIKDIKIPIPCIPSQLYKKYKKLSKLQNNKTLKLIK